MLNLDLTIKSLAINDLESLIEVLRPEWVSEISSLKETVFTEGEQICNLLQCSLN